MILQATSNLSVPGIEEIDSLVAKVVQQVPSTISEQIEHNDIAINGVGLHSLIIGLFVIVFLGIVFWGINRRRVWKAAERALPVLFAATWVLGFVVYDVGMCTESRISLLRNAPMAIIHAFQMFLLESDVSAIHEPFHNNAWYMGFFSLSHFLAAFVSLVFVIKYFGFQITSSVSRFFASHSFKQKERDVLYLFWGMNEQSYLLAKSIQKFHAEDEKGKNQSYRLMVIRTNHDNEERVVQNGIDRMFNVLSLGGKDLRHLEELSREKHFYTTSTYRDLSKLEAPTEKSNIFDELRLKSVMRFIDRTSYELHIFCLSDDENENLHTVSVLKEGARVANRDLNTTFYCHARKYRAGSSIENSLDSERIRVRIIDSARMVIDTLKLFGDDSDMPVHYVDLNNEGASLSSFNALIVGFGEAGRDALRFLYEYSALVYSQEQADDEVQRLPFCCHVVDSRMDSIAPQFLARYNRTNLGGNISFHSADYRSTEFQNTLSEILPTLNYVVITIHDDEEGISLATRILQQAIQTGKDMRKFRIYVRSYSREKQKQLQNICDHFNRQAYAEFLRQTGQKCTNQEAWKDLYIKLLGKTDDIYSYQMIVSDEITRKAAHFYYVYDRKRATNDDAQAMKAWKLRRKKEVEKDFFATELNNGLSFATINKIRRMEEQDLENAFHQRTKLYILRHVLGEEALQQLAQDIENGKITRQEKTLTYRTKDGRLLSENLSSLLLVLAKTEHLRWNASHEMLGYVHGETKDETRLTHNCLLPWSELESDATKSYDLDVVDTTLRLYTEEFHLKESI